MSPIQFIDWILILFQSGGLDEFNTPVIGDMTEGPLPEIF